MTRSITSRAAAAAVIALALAAGCSSNTEPAAAPGTSGAVASGTTPGTTARATVERPAGPAADVSEELTGGNGVFLGQITGVDLAGNGYVEHEYVAAGTATTYVADGEPADDGAIDVTEGETDDYRTRIVVRRPENPDDFNGTVVMEWLNVSGGLDANPDFSYAADELLRNGYAWVGVSAQKIGVEGGEVAVTVPIGEGLSGQGLKALDPARYGTLAHPGDGYSYDIFTQVARAVRGEGGADLLGGAEVDQILAAGESQSGFALTTYVNAIAPETQAFDGYLIHSRGGPGLPLGTPGAAISIVDAITGGPTTIRSDIAVPVLQLETETDLVSVIGFLPARQPDTDLLRTWEVAATAHADRGLIGPVADSLDCGAPINDGPHGFAVRSALRHLDTWVRTGEAPPTMPQLEIDESGESPAIARDADGIALGGIRYPVVDVPVQVLSGDPGPAPDIICLLTGTTNPIPAERLAELYASPDAYTAAFTEATDAAIATGALLAEDRQAMLDEAQPELLTP